MSKTLALLALAAFTTISTAGPLQRLRDRRSNTTEIVVVQVKEAKPAPAKELAKPPVTVTQRTRNRNTIAVTVTPAAACPNCK